MQVQLLDPLVRDGDHRGEKELMSREYSYFISKANGKIILMLVILIS